MKVESAKYNKDIDDNKWVKVDGFKDALVAKSIIEKSGIIS